MKYFSLSELCYSDTAKKNGWDNTPNSEQAIRLKLLTELLLDDLRENWGSPLIVSSGFRTPQLNKAVKGSKSSAHMLGYAADIVPKNRKINELKSFIINWAKDKQFDQIIIEKDSYGKEWVHIGLYNNSGEQRMQLFNVFVK